MRDRSSPADRPAPAGANPFDADWATALFAGAMQLQRMQFEAFLCWHAALTAVNRDAWDGWICRVAGGVPIDG